MLIYNHFATRVHERKRILITRSIWHRQNRRLQSDGATHTAALQAGSTEVPTRRIPNCPIHASLRRVI